MSKPDKHSYDVIIIGAGISGLVCGCYLAKAGKKVLIAEQHHKPGGYCTSFRRMGFFFDAAVHSFGGYRENGIVKKVFNDLGIDKRIKITRFDPSDIIITSDYKVSFWADLNRTITEFQKAFPEESNNIEKFFNFLTTPDPNSFVKLRSWTFKQLLDQYFTTDRLKSILAFPIFGNGGLPPSLMTAFIGAKLFSEFILDGGYYPEGGMQVLPNILAERFTEFGGDLRLSNLVTKIDVKDNTVLGVTLEKEGPFFSKQVISNCDARQTYFKLLGEKVVDNNFLDKIDKMIPSVSFFILYLGIDKSIQNLPDRGINVWFLSQYNLDHAYNAINKASLNSVGGHMLRVLPNRQSIVAFVPAPFKNKQFWIDNKKRYLESFIERIEQYSIPGLSKHIIYKDAATPCTLHKYTLNYDGAAYGWASIPSQFADPEFRKPLFINGFYQTGHWTTLGMGIPGVTFLGYDIANFLIKKKLSDIN